MNNFNGSTYIAEAPSALMLQGDKSGDIMRPFMKEQLVRNERFFNSDPIFKSAFETLLSFMYGANVVVTKARQAKHDPSSGETSKAAPQLATAEFEQFILRVFPGLIASAIRALWVDGFVGFSIEKKDKFSVPVILHPRLYVPAVRLQKGRIVDLVALRSDMKSTDKSIHIFSRETHTLTGEVLSLASSLVADWEEQTELRQSALHMDRLASQNLQLVEAATQSKESNIEVSTFADCDKMAREANTTYTTTETSMEQFHAHEERDRERLLAEGVIAPTLKPIPSHYRLARGVYPTTRTNIVATEEVRQDTLFATCGVPKSLVMATNKMSADSTAAFRTMNATLHRVRLTLSDLFREMYLQIYPDDEDVEFEIEVETLIMGEQIEKAGLNGFISEKNFGRLFLRNANIPVSVLHKGLSTKPAKPESRELQPTLTSTVDGATSEAKAKDAEKKKAEDQAKKSKAKDSSPSEPAKKKTKSNELPL
jgi:hypothetical protein